MHECFLSLTLESLVNPEVDQWRTKRRWKWLKIGLTNGLSESQRHLKSRRSDFEVRSSARATAAKLCHALEFLAKTQQKLRRQEKLQDEILRAIELSTASGNADRPRNGSKKEDAYCQMLGIPWKKKLRMNFYDEYRHFWHRLPSIYTKEMQEFIHTDADVPRDVPRDVAERHFRQLHSATGTHVAVSRGSLWCSLMSRAHAPRICDFVFDDGTAHTNMVLADGRYSNHHLDAVAHAVANSNLIVKRVSLAQGNFDDHHVGNFLDKIVQDMGRKDRRLQSLDLSGNPLKQNCLGVLVKALQSIPLSHLHTLNLRDVAIGGATWECLLSAIPRDSLRNLDLSHTTLGSSFQGHICVLADCVKNMRLTELNIGSNFIRHEGANALGEMLGSGSLHFLDVSRNAGGFDASRANYQFNPLLLLLVHLRSSSLRVLACASCMLGWEADTILECELVDHPTMRELDLSDNPHGVDGLRHLLCLVAHHTCAVACIRLNSYAITFNTIAKDRATQYFYSTPNNNYCLDLAHPAQRATLCHLVRRAMDVLGSEWEMAWSNMRYKTLPVRTIFSGTNLQDFPSEGKLEFTFRIDGDDCADTAMVVRSYVRRGKLVVSLNRFLALVKMYESIQVDAMRWTFVQSLQFDLLLKMSYIKFFFCATPHLVSDIACTLLPTLDTKLHHIQMLADTATKRKTRRLVWFNAHQCDGHYKLDLGNACDHQVLQRLLLVNAWHIEQSRRLKFAHVNIRNFVSHHARYKLFSDVQAENAFGGPCNVEFDYVSPRSTVQNQLPMSSNRFESLVRFFLSVPKRYDAKENALRSCIELIIIDPPQLRLLLRLFPGYGRKAVSQRDMRSFKSILKCVYSDGDVSNGDVSNREAYKMSNGDCMRSDGDVSNGEAYNGDCMRTHIFHMLFNRTIDPETLFGPCFVYNSEPDGMLSPQSIVLCRKRIGFRFMNWMNFPPRCCQYNLRSSSQRLLAIMLFELATLEGTQFLQRVSFSGAPNSDPFIIPRGWRTDMPHAGILKFAYTCPAEKISFPVRFELGQRYLGW